MTNHFTNLKLSGFTAFEDLNLDFTDGVTALVGDNGTGKTHILQVLHAAAAASAEGEGFPEALVGAFLPRDNSIGRLVRRRHGRARASITVARSAKLKISTEFSTAQKIARGVTVSGDVKWWNHPMVHSYIPVKEMLSHAPGFQSTLRERELHFPSMYADVLQKAFLPAKRGPPGADRAELLDLLRTDLTGKPSHKNEMFFLRQGPGQLEFDLVSEGHRKLALLYILIQNETLSTGTVLLWDEPEANLNPRRARTVARILHHLARLGTQVIITSHDYVLLRYLELEAGPESPFNIIGLTRQSQTKGVQVNRASSLAGLPQSAILDTFGDLFDLELESTKPEDA